MLPPCRSISGNTLHQLPKFSSWLVPKHDPGKFLLIHDLSFPKGDPITSKEFTTVQYESLDRVVELFRTCGPHCLIAKADIQEAFRLIPIKPQDYPLMGFTWQGIFLQSFNGKSMFLEQKFLSSQTIKLYTDASRELGFTLVFGKKWVTGSWHKHFTSAGIALLELYTLVLTTELFRKYFANHCILFMTDNFGVVDIINKTTSKNRPIMKLVRQLVLVCLKYNLGTFLAIRMSLLIIFLACRSTKPNRWHRG